MPISIPDEAVAAGTHSAAATASAAASTQRRSRTYWSPSQHAPETLFELDLRLPAQDLPGPRDVGLPDLRIGHRQCLVDDLAARVDQLEQRLGELEDRELARVADV